MLELKYVVSEREDKRRQDREFYQHPGGTSKAANPRGSGGKTLFALGLMISTFSGSIEAGPQGGQVVGGSASISQTNAQRMDITQHSQRAIIDWRSFSIAQPEQVNFQQPSRNAAALNRVTGPQVSQIQGQLTANGQVFLVNPNGILFGKNARIDVGSLVASTTNIRNDDFMAGRYRFEDVINDRGVIINRGEINAAEGGLVALVAPGVENTGTIRARLGRVVLASANKFTLDFYGDEVISFAVDDETIGELRDSEGKLLPARVNQAGVIEADGGTVMLATSTAKSVLDNVINMDGMVRARSVVEQNGEIVLLGEGDGKVQIAGTLDASGRDAGQTGGAVKVLGKEVKLADGTSIDVSGDVGGGDAHIGGGYQGKGELRTATNTTVNSDAKIQADALTDGDGGEVVVWADGQTDYAGMISAEGGAYGGDGGLVEVSGKEYLYYVGEVSLKAPSGEGGTLLLDPEDFVVNDLNAESLGYTLAFGNLEIRAQDNVIVRSLLDGRNEQYAPSGNLLIVAEKQDVQLYNDILTTAGNVTIRALEGNIVSSETSSSLITDGLGTLISTRPPDDVSVSRVGIIDLYAAKDIVSPVLDSDGSVKLTSASGNIHLENAFKSDGEIVGGQVGDLSIVANGGDVQLYELLFPNGSVDIQGTNVTIGRIGFKAFEGSTEIIGDAKGPVTITGSGEVRLTQNIYTDGTTVDIGGAGASIIIDPPQPRLAADPTQIDCAEVSCLDTQDAIRHFTDGTVYLIDDDSLPLSAVQGSGEVTVASGDDFVDSLFQNIPLLVLEINTQGASGGIRFRGMVDIAEDLRLNEYGVVGRDLANDPVSGVYPSKYVKLDLIAGSGGVSFENGLAASRPNPNNNGQPINLALHVDEVPDGNLPAEPTHTLQDDDQLFNTVALSVQTDGSFNVGAGSTMVLNELKLGVNGLDQVSCAVNSADCSASIQGGGDVMIAHRSYVSVVDDGGNLRAVYPYFASTDAGAPVSPEPPEALLVGLRAPIRTPPQEPPPAPPSPSAPGRVTVDRLATAGLATGAYASTVAEATAEQLAMDDEEQDENEEKEEGKSEEIALQIVFPGGRGVAQKADLGRRRPSEGAAPDVFAEAVAP